MATAKKLPSGNYRVMLYVGKDVAGKRQYKSFTAESPDEAEYMALEYKLQKKRLSNVENITLDEAINRYIISKSNLLSPSTIEGYRQIQRNRFANIRHVLLGNLTNAMIQAEINREAASLAPKTIANAHGLLSAVLKEHLPDFNLTTRLPQREEVIYNIPTETDMRRIINALRGTEIELPVTIALWLGLRMSEVRGLKWANVHEDYILIDEAIVYAAREHHKKKPKTTSSKRKVLLPQHIKNLLDAAEKKGEYITTLTGSGIYKRFVRLLAREGIPHYRFHDLRVMNASVMLALNVPDKYAMQRGGWSTPSTLKRVYQQVLNEEQRAVADRIDQYFGSLIE